MKKQVIKLALTAMVLTTSSVFAMEELDKNAKGIYVKAVVDEETAAAFAKKGALSLYWIDGDRMDSKGGLSADFRGPEALEERFSNFCPFGDTKYLYTMGFNKEYEKEQYLTINTRGGFCKLTKVKYDKVPQAGMLYTAYVTNFVQGPTDNTSTINIQWLENLLDNV